MSAKTNRTKPVSAGRIGLDELAQLLNRSVSTIRVWADRLRVDVDKEEESIRADDVKIFEKKDGSSCRKGRWRTDAPPPPPQALPEPAAVARNPVQTLMPNACASVTIPIDMAVISAASLTGKTPRQFCMDAVTAHMASIKRLLGRG